jgi:hypothetical protein
MIYSFSKPAEPQRLAGARFDDGKIAYQDEAGEIRGTESEKKRCPAWWWRRWPMKTV